MTDNEQGYTPTEASARVRHIFAKEWGGDYVQGAAEFDRAMAATLAAHRVTLVADSREALAEGFAREHEGYPSWDQVPRYRQNTITAAIDALLASGVVHVTTPTETDERASIWAAIHWLEDQAESEEGEELVEGLRHSARLFAALGSRPAPVAPPTEEWEYGSTSKWGCFAAPSRARAEENAQSLRAAIAEGRESGDLAYHGKVVRRRPRVVAGPWQPVDPDQALVVPVDALGFPTQVGATFTARFAVSGRKAILVVLAPGDFEVPGYSGTWHPDNLDPASIEDVRPADGRNGQ